MSDGAFACIHFIGVGGAGLSALARLTLLMGYGVSGSDRTRTPVIDDLEAMGLAFQEGHEPNLIRQADLVVVSSAIGAGNKEMTWAAASGVPVWKRHQLLPWLTAGKRVLAVAGTHGKTTITALLSHVLTATGRDPTCLIGGILKNWGSNARLGSSDLFVLEADEYDRTFLSLHPWLGLITSIEMDHPDCYASVPELVEVFSRFAHASEQVLACADDGWVKEATAGIERLQTYGWDGAAEWRLLSWDGRPEGCAFRFVDAAGMVHEGWVPLWGGHSVSNALAVVAAAAITGVTVRDVLVVMRDFQGVARRFAVSGPYAGVHLVDDYAHHPSQIVAIVSAARQRFPGARIMVVFQPHTFSRLAALRDDFVAALKEADSVFVLPVYAAREEGDADATAVDLARVLGAVALPPPRQAADVLLPWVQAGDVVLNLNAGDGETLTEALAAGLKDREASCDT